ncbi:MAG: motif putative anchor domain protein [Chthoniobacteraceae bacterium]|nr:motif putative anchor domain protein [Chthoniobacteraceae bacterium]
MGKISLKADLSHFVILTKRPKVPALHALLLITAICAPSDSFAQEARYIASGVIPANTLDLEGETVGGIGSGITYDAKEDVYLAVSDRGAGDGTIDYMPRFDTMKVTVSSEVTPTLNAGILKTTLLRTTSGKPMCGLIPDARNTATPQMHDGRHCIDAEAIAIAPDDTLYIADEYGPYLHQFKRDGTLIRTIEPPGNYLPRTAEGKLDFTDNDSLVSGRVPNHGFEGLTLSPDGKLAFLILQSGLLQDGGKSARYSRILVINLATGKPVAEYAYAMADSDKINSLERRIGKFRLKQNDLAVSEIAMVNEHQFLVLERDNFGANGSFKVKRPSQKCVFLIDIKDATNLLSLPGQPYSQPYGVKKFRELTINEKITPPRKTLLLNFAAPIQGLDRNDLAAKWEGIALTPPDSEGHQRMLLTCDNDFLSSPLLIAGKSIPFPRAERSMPTRFLLFDIRLP